MGQIRVRRALISVYDKTGIVEFARSLHADFGIEIISTGGTAKTLREAGISVTLIEDITGFPEMLDGRVKTLHPNIHAAILADRDNPEHMRQLEAAGIKPIDMVVVNLYPFEKTVADPSCTLDQAIEMIDIGGVALLRAAAKNAKHVWVVTDPSDYDWVILGLRHEKSGKVRGRYAEEHAHDTFVATADYDNLISSWMGKVWSEQVLTTRAIRVWEQDTLRYGENPSQSAQALLVDALGKRWPFMLEMSQDGAATSMSYNNYLDADAALALCAELSRSLYSGEEPQASACADVRRQNASSVPTAPPPAAASPSPQSQSIHDALQPPDSHTPTWFLTWTTYGTWLPGDARGFVSRAPQADGRHFPNNIPGQWYDADQQDLAESARERMHGTPVHLSPAQVDTLLASFAEVCLNHQIGLLAVAVMTDHVHIACQSDRDGADLLRFFKGVSARRLSQVAKPPAAPRWWTKSGSRRYIPAGSNLEPVVSYVEQQQNSLAVLSSRGGAGRGTLANARPLETQTTARAEARGSLAAHAKLLVTPTTARAEARGSSSGSSAVCVFIKHSNACGVGIASAAAGSAAELLDAQLSAYRAAYLGDPNAAMGGILACNFRVEAEFAAAVMSTFDRLGKPLRDAGAAHAPGGFFVEVWLAPEFSDAAAALIRGKPAQLEKARDIDGLPLAPERIAEVRALIDKHPPKKWGETVRLLMVGDLNDAPDPDAWQYRSIAGGLLAQTPDTLALNESDWKIATNRAPTDAEMRDLRLAWLICKHTRSNAISICKDGRLIGNGAGQMSRVMSCRIATWLAKENGHADALAGSVAASDAFFPFKDGPQLLIDAGVTALIQPGGSKRDDETIALCNERGIAMILTGTRHFRH